MGVSAQLKSFIDRCQALWSRKYVLKQALVSPDRGKRSGYFISTAGTKGDKKIFEGAIIVIKAIFHTLDIKYSGELLFNGIDNKGDIINHPDALQTAFKTGTSLNI